MILDVDGTVCESCQPLSDEMVKRLMRLSVSHRLVFISGSSRENLEQMISSKLNVKHELLPEYGATEVHWLPNQKARVIGLLRSLLESLSIKPITEDYILERQYQITLSCLGRSAPAEAKARFDPAGDLRRQLIRRFRELSPMCGVESSYRLHIGGTTSVDVGFYDKRRGIVEFLKGRTDAIFVGDQFGPWGNDRSVLGLIPCFVVGKPADFLQLAPLISRL